MNDKKYVVFKREDWDTFIAYPYVSNGAFQLKDTMLDDAVVIRTRDTFAGPALHTYASSIALVSRTLKELAPTVSDRLQEIADYFHSRAIEADEHYRPKLPD